MHQNEWFQVWYFKNFLGRGSPSPLPRPLPPLFLGLRPRFGLRPQFSGASRPRLGLRPRYSGASRPRFGLRPQLSIGDLGLAPPKINSWIRPCLLPGCSVFFHLRIVIFWCVSIIIDLLFNMENMCWVGLWKNCNFSFEAKLTFLRYIPDY